MTSLFPIVTFFASIVAFVYVISNGYLLKHAQILQHIDGLNQCSEFSYPDTYFRKRVQEQNQSYIVYNIQIGKILSRNMSRSQRQKFQHKIQKDLLRNQLNSDKMSEHNIKLRALYEKYFNEFHYDGVLRCPWNKPKTVDFFSFIQSDAKPARNAIVVPIEYEMDDSAKNYFIELPTDHIPTFKTEHSHHVTPQLFSYTLSIHPSARLDTLEFRFGEIKNAEQHDNTKHLLLNGVHTHLLWAGEFWYFYDHNEQQYVLVMDNDSGHWKPEMYAKPQYLEDIMLQSLFPNYVYNASDESNDRPVLMVGYKEDPWKRLKLVLFPVIDEIAQRDHDRYEKKKREEREWIKRQIEKSHKRKRYYHYYHRY